MLASWLGTDEIEKALLRIATRLGSLNISTLPVCFFLDWKAQSIKCSTAHSLGSYNPHSSLGIVALIKINVIAYTAGSCSRNHLLAFLTLFSAFKELCACVCKMFVLQVFCSIDYYIIVLLTIILLEIQGVSTFYRPIWKTKALNDSFLSF